jgi:MOSC domain-containing protein YiiM
MPTPEFVGELIGICITRTLASEMQSVGDAQALTGIGLKGDRYALRQGTFSAVGEEPIQQVTLIEEEALIAALRDHQTTITHAMSRRNLLTRGVPLNHLVDQTFAIGEVLIRGVELCEPCRHLQKLTCPEILKPLIHRGGLRAAIIRGGTLHVGQAIRRSD